MEKVLNTLFPPRCFYCGENYGDLCRECLQKCKVARNYYCVVCDEPAIKGETHVNCTTKYTPASVFSAYEYKGIVRKCVMKAKYSSRTFAPLKRLAEEAAHIASKCSISYQGFIVTPIPLSRSRSRQRGFNQAGLIAAAIAREFSTKFEDSILIRDKETSAQHGNTRKERFDNMRGAFKVVRNTQAKKILIVDDICTTGATILEASRALHEAGVQEIRCFTLAKEF